MCPQASSEAGKGPNTLCRVIDLWPGATEFCLVLDLIMVCLAWGSKVVSHSYHPLLPCQRDVLSAVLLFIERNMGLAVLWPPLLNGWNPEPTAYWNQHSTESGQRPILPWTGYCCTFMDLDYCSQLEVMWAGTQVCSTAALGVLWMLKWI